MSNELSAQIRTIGTRTLMEIYCGEQLVATVRPSAEGITIASELLMDMHGRGPTPVTIDVMAKPPEMHIRLL